MSSSTEPLRNKYTSEHTPTELKVVVRIHVINMELVAHHSGLGHIPHPSPPLFEQRWKSRPGTDRPVPADRSRPKPMAAKRSSVGAETQRCWWGGFGVVGLDQVEIQIPSGLEYTFTSL